MSNKRVGQYYGLYVETGNSPTGWTLIACLNNKEFSIDNKVIDATSDCGPDFLKGFANSKVTGKGFVTYDDNTVDSGYAVMALAQLASNASTKNFMLAPATPVSGDLIRTWEGFVNAYKETANTDAAIEFDFGIQVQGDISQAIY